MSQRLKDKVAIITGGAAGMGRATALRFAHEGARVIIADTNVSEGKGTAGEIEKEGGEAVFIATDVSQGREVDEMAAQTLSRYGGIDVIYCNAGIQLHGKDAAAHELSEDIWDQTMAVNLRGAWLCAKHVIPAMLDRGGGSIILAASPTGLTGGGAGYTAYSASKGGIIALTRVMAADYGSRNIRVNALVPGPMETPLISSLLADHDIRRNLESQTMLRRIGKAEEVAGLATFLASDEASYCTGGIYMADGGITAL